MRVSDKVALITGAARGQGRSHALRLAEEGADIIGIDVCGPVESVTHYPPATSEDLTETERLIRSIGRSMFSAEIDVRDVAELGAAVAQGVERHGRGLDIVVANAAIISFAQLKDLTSETWQETIDINLTGVWNTVQAAEPHLNDNASIVLIGSTAGRKGFANCGPYVAAKHGVVGLMRTIAAEWGGRGIRANVVHPTAVATPMHLNEEVARLFVPEAEAPTEAQFAQRCQSLHHLPVPWLDPRDISNAVLFLASDEARYITGAQVPVDAGFTER